MKILSFGQIFPIAQNKLAFSGFMFEAEEYILFDGNLSLLPGVKEKIISAITNYMADSNVQFFLTDVQTIQALGEENAAIAPPVAAGSVDMQRFDPQERYGESAMAEVEEGDYVLHADAIAWGVQQRAQGEKEASDSMEKFLQVKHGLIERAEKAEAELAQVNQWYRTAHQISEDLAARILKADDRIEELETEIKVLHRG